MIVIVTLLAVLVAAELLVRAIEPRLAEPNLWPEALTGQKARFIEAAAADGRTADIVVVGSSVALDGIDPRALQEGLGDDMTIFNAAIPIARIASLRRWTNDIVVPALQPKLVIVAVTSRAFHDVDAGEDYDRRLAASTGYRALSGSDNGLAFRLDRRLSDAFAVFRARSALRDFERSFSSLLGREVDLGYELAADGHRRPDDVSYRVPNEWDPATSDLLDFSMGGRDQLQSLVDGLAASGIGVLFVNMPVTDHYISLHGTAEYENFLRDFESWSTSEGAAFIDLAPHRPVGMYWDPAHLTPEGAVVVSRALGEEMRTRRLGS